MTFPISERFGALATGLGFAVALACAQPAAAHDDPHGRTATPIKHVIIVVGENHTFDNLFGTYRPKHGQSIDNLLSKGIGNADGTPGPHFARAQQLIGTDTDGYHAVTASTGAYDVLPQPYTTSGIGLPADVPDTRFPDNLPNGPFQISA